MITFLLHYSLVATFHTRSSFVGGLLLTLRNPHWHRLLPFPLSIQVFIILMVGFVASSTEIQTTPSSDKRVRQG